MTAPHRLTLFIKLVLSRMATSRCLGKCWGPQKLEFGILK